jgi:DNA uptake protein ComE-like DNA-binding protein
MSSPLSDTTLTFKSVAYDPCIPIVALLWLVMLAAALPSLAIGDDAVSPAPARVTIDPNTAPWWELTVLPRIGESTARKIVRYRESARTISPDGAEVVAFGCAADLAGVRGIGPKTLQRIGRYLDF